MTQAISHTQLIDIADVIARTTQAGLVATFAELHTSHPRMTFEDYTKAKVLAAEKQTAIFLRRSDAKDLRVYLRAKAESERTGLPIEFVDDPEPPVDTSPAIEIKRSEAKDHQAYLRANAESERTGLPLRFIDG
jgi:hypothetical protein